MVNLTNEHLEKLPKREILRIIYAYNMHVKIKGYRNMSKPDLIHEILKRISVDETSGALTLRDEMVDNENKKVSKTIKPKEIKTRKQIRQKELEDIENKFVIDNPEFSKLNDIVKNTNEGLYVNLLGQKKKYIKANVDNITKKENEKMKRKEGRALTQEEKAQLYKVFVNKDRELKRMDKALKQVKDELTKK
jgi:hypothetical protein